jgi:hypothetical protein
MKIKLLTSRAGVGFAQSAGDEIEVSDAEGARMVEAGQAIPVREATRETATRKPAREKAAK